MYGSDILRGISKVPLEIPHKISDPYIERYDFYTTSKFSELLDLRAHTRYWNAPPDTQRSGSDSYLVLNGWVITKNTLPLEY